MKDITDDELDKLFQDAAAHFVPDVDAETAWISMQQKLDFPKLKGKMISITIFEVSVLLFLLLLSGLFSNSGEKMAIAPSQKMESKTVTVELGKTVAEENSSEKKTHESIETKETTSYESQQGIGDENGVESQKGLESDESIGTLPAASEKDKSYFDNEISTKSHRKNKASEKANPLIVVSAQEMANGDSEKAYQKVDLKTSIVANKSTTSNENESGSNSKSVKKLAKTKTAKDAKASLIVASTQGIANGDSEKAYQKVDLKTPIVANKSTTSNENESGSNSESVKKLAKTKTGKDAKASLIVASTQGVDNNSQSNNWENTDPNNIIESPITTSRNGHNKQAEKISNANRKPAKNTSKSKVLPVVIATEKPLASRVGVNDQVSSIDNKLAMSDKSKNVDNSKVSARKYKKESNKKLAVAKRRTKSSTAISNVEDESLAFQNLNEFKKGNYAIGMVEENAETAKSKRADQNQISNRKYVVESINRGQIDSRNTDEKDNSTGGFEYNTIFEKPSNLNMLKIKKPNLFLDSLEFAPLVFPNELTEATPSYYQPNKAITRVKNSLRLNIMTSLDLSSVGFKTIDRPGWNLGITLEYSFMKRFTLISGVIYSVKKYSASGEDYHGASSWTAGTLNSINGGCTVIDIPVNLRYDIFQRRKYTIFSTVGFSSYLMKKEDYNYNFWYNNSARHYSWEVNNKNKHYFGVINFSVGYERQISKRVSLQVEPFIKVPIVGVGYNKIDLTSSGMFFSVRYKLR